MYDPDQDSNRNSDSSEESKLDEEGELTQHLNDMWKRLSLPFKEEELVDKW